MKSLNNPNRIDMTWPVLKAFNDLYEKKRTSAKIQQDDFVRYLMAQRDLIATKKGNDQVLVAKEGFEDYYLSNFKEVYGHYHQFFLLAEISPDARKTFTEEDIKTLMMVYENRETLKTNLSNIEDFSSKIFDYGGSKYLKFRDSVRNAVLKILGIAEFPQTSKELQYRLVVDHTDPKAIILCENKSFIKQPWVAKELEVKLWYVGGNNIAIIDDIDRMELRYPVFYSCDWDFDGLRIYQRIKAKLKSRGAEVKLMIPPPPHMYLPVDSFKHKSMWRLHLDLSGLDAKSFNENELRLIRILIDRNQWLEEESNVLRDMYWFNLEG